MEAVLMDKKKTGNLIREARTKKNYTQSELGDLLGVSNKAISRWENGECFPAMSVIYMAVLYSDLLHRMSTTEGAIENLAVRTIVTIFITGIFMMITRLNGLAK